MRKLCAFWVNALAVCVLMATLAHGQESPTYTPPAGKKILMPGYPKELSKPGQEGWVLLTCMVDRHGKAYEVAVVDSNGFEAFEKSAVANMDRAEFRPAKFDGREVDSVHRMTYMWTLLDRTPLAAEFQKSFEAASRATRKGDRQRADEVLASIKALSLDEDAWHNMLLDEYYAHWGTPSQRLAVLRRAAGMQDRNFFLPARLLGDALRSRLALEIQLSDFGGALQTWEIVAKAKKTDEFPKTYQAAIDDIHKRRTDDRSHTIAGEVDHRGSWFVQLLKRKFAIAVPSGKVSHLKLRCERGFFSYEFEPGKQYETDENAGECQLQAIGKAGTALELRQL